MNPMPSVSCWNKEEMKRLWDEEKLKIVEISQTKVNIGNNLRALRSKKKTIGKA
jgi:hypothetical protein